MARSPRILISYRHESDEHAELVRGLSDQLRRDGIDAVIDRYVPAPAQGWSWWMEDELKKADRVIVVCSEGYLESALREAEKGQGRGTSWEWHLIRKDFYDSRGAGERITPVFFKAGDEKYIPPEAWDRPRYCIADLRGDEYRRLLDDLFRRPDAPPPPIGGSDSVGGTKHRVEPRGIESRGTGVRDRASPRVYLSYTHDSEDHKAWVAELAQRLHYDGVDVTFDYWFMEPGKDFWDCLDAEVAHAEVAVLVCTPAYRAKAMGLRDGGLKREYDQFVARSKSEDEFRVIPLICEGEWADAVPPEFSTRFGYVLRHGEFDLKEYAKLRTALLGRWRPGSDAAETAPDARGRTARADLASRHDAKEAVTAIIPTMKVICPLHGIRTLAVWQKGLSDLAASHGWVCRLDRWSYGRFSLLAFFTPWSREAKLGWLRRQYDAETHDRRLLIEKGQAPSVVAHSFGTYILGYTLLRFDFIRFNKVILCGSILPRDFPWDQLIARGQVQAVRNEFGVRDPWVKWVRWFVRGTGPSGAVGFTCQHPRLEQEEFDFDHGDYFGLDHMEDRWVPFLDRPLPEIPRAEAGPRIPRPKTALPWGLYAVMLALALLAGAVAAYVASRRGTGTTAASPASATAAKSAPPAPAPAAVLEGYVTDAETRVPLADVKLTIQDWDTRDGGSPTATTDAAGRFRFGDLRPSDDPTRQVRLIATKPGYDTSTTDPPLGATDHPIKLKTLTPPEGRP